MVYSVAATLQLQTVVRVILRPTLNVLYFYTHTLRSICAVPNMAVVCSSLILCFLTTSLSYCLNDSEAVPFAHIITVITYSCIFHVCCIYIVRYLYFIIFSAHFLVTFLSPEISTSINIHVSFSLPWIVMSSLLLGLVLSVCTSWFHNMFTLPS